MSNSKPNSKSKSHESAGEKVMNQIANPGVLDPIGDRTMIDLLDEQVEARGDSTFLIFESSEREITELTYAELRAEVEQLRIENQLLRQRIDIIIRQLYDK